jgi:hypothetical protein
MAVICYIQMHLLQVMVYYFFYNPIIACTDHRGQPHLHNQQNDYEGNHYPHHNFSEKECNSIPLSFL